MFFSSVLILGISLNVLLSKEPDAVSSSLPAKGVIHEINRKDSTKNNYLDIGASKVNSEKAYNDNNKNNLNSSKLDNNRSEHHAISSTPKDSKDASLENRISTYAYDDFYKFRDNNFYKDLRISNAQKQLSKYAFKNNEMVFVTDKTFQKTMLFQIRDNYTITPLDSVETMSGDINQTYLYYGQFSVAKLSRSYRFIEEFDCSTGKNHGNKTRFGDAKTPEGIFSALSIETSHNNTFDGYKVYGPYFVRLVNSIGFHGNGTDTVKVKSWKSDRAYKEPEPIGIYDNNFGHGLSHGCIRQDNSVVRRLVESSTIKNMTRFVVYEDTNLTSILNKNYWSDDKNRPVSYTYHHSSVERKNE